MDMAGLGDFTFPATTTAAATAAAAPEPAGPGRPACRLRLPHFAGAPLWFPPHSPTAGDASMVAEEEPLPGAEEPPRPEKAGAGGEAPAPAPADEEVEDRMDLLWEDFNEELALRRRAGRGSCSRGGLEVSSESDAESEPAGCGCAPLVLRPSSRVGGAGQYRRRAGSWVLLMRIFRRLFVIEKTISAAGRQHAATSTRAR
uniref:Uncharacterized protein n=1 Tax=Arundo donax TaxID=35708 RepID=A0A0A9HPY4_ARUDO